MASWAEEQRQMLDDARKEQAQILRDAAETRNKMIADAKEQAQAEAAKILADARAEIAAEKDAAIRDVRREVALLSVSIAEKILRKELADEGAQREYIDRMVEETVREDIHS
jgi:F-type H+-transporting ATPase subunit b